MNRNSIRWRLPASYAVIALLAALSLGSMMLLVLRDYYADQELEYLYGNATALQPVIAELLESNLPKEVIQEQVQVLAFLSQTQIRLLDANGNILADSGAPDQERIMAVSSGPPIVGTTSFGVPAEPPFGQTRVLIYSNGDDIPKPNVQFEKQFVPGKSTDIILPVSASPYGYGFVARAEADPTRRSSQSVEVLLVSPDRRKLGTLEFSHGPSYGADVIDSVTLAWLIASTFAIAVAAMAGWYASQQVTRPVLALEHATHEMARGDLSVRVDLQNEKQQEFLSLASSFNGMAEQVEQTVSTLRAFVADAAHELHTPLTALQTNLELARDEKTASKRTLYLSRVQEQSQRLEALVTSLLDLSRIEAAQAKSDFESVDVIRIVREIGEQFASRAEQANRSFTLDIPDETLNVLGNETQLRQVLVNLLENALKFTPEDGQISLRLERSANEIALTVSDSGIGIPPEDLPHLFERFHRARNVADYAGNGLGLAIVKAIVESHAGTVEAHSVGIGEGSRFVVKLKRPSP